MFSSKRGTGNFGINSVPESGLPTQTGKIRVVDPDPDWIRIQRLCGSRSVLGIRIPDPGARKLRNISVKIHFLVIFKKIVTTMKVQCKIALSTF
jgi:hypothetical protein